MKIIWKKIERLQLSQEKADDLANLLNHLLIKERFEKIQSNPPHPIIWIDVDGSGSYPLNFTKKLKMLEK